MANENVSTLMPVSQWEPKPVQCTVARWQCLLTLPALPRNWADKYVIGPDEKQTNQCVGDQLRNNMLVLLLYAVLAVAETCPPCDISTCPQVFLNVSLVLFVTEYNRYVWKCTISLDTSNQLRRNLLVYVFVNCAILCVTHPPLFG